MKMYVVVLLLLFQVGAALPFTEWLQQLSLNFANVPEISLTLPTGPATVDIESGSCHNISIGNLSVGSAVGNASGFATSFQLDGLGLQCQIKVSNAHLSVGRLPINSGELDITFSIVPSLVSGGLAIPSAQYQMQLPPLPEGANLTECGAALDLSLHATGHTLNGKSAAAFINGLAGAFTPEFVNNTVCGILGPFVDGRLSETLRNASSKLVASNGLIEAGDLPEPALSSHATNINELMQTGTFGRAFQQVIHGGRYDVSNSTQLLEIVRGFLNILQPKGVPQMLSNLRDDDWSVPLPFSLESSIGKLSGDVALDKCAGNLPSPLLAGTTTDHAQRFNTGNFTGQCGADLHFSLPVQTLGTANFSVDMEELNVSTSLAAEIEDLSIYLSLLVGIDGYSMVNEFSLDQWTRPACLVQMLDGKDASNLGLLGLTGTLGGAVLDMRALDQDSTIGSVLPALSQWVNALLQAYQPAINSLLHGSATSSLVGYINEKVIQNWLNTDDQCTASGYQSPVNQPAADVSGIWIAAFGGLALVTATLLLVQCTITSVRKVEGGQQNLLTASDQAEEAGMANPTLPQTHEDGALSTLSGVSKWTLNLFLFATAGILVASFALPNINLQLTVTDTDPKGEGATTQTGENVLEFTIWSLALDLFRYGLPEVSVLLVLGCVVLPMMQIVLMLACLNLPPSVLSTKRRGHILAWLLLTLRTAWLGTFLLAILVKCMSVPFIHDDGAGGTARFYIEVCPEVGFYIYSFAALASMCLNEVIVASHRKAAGSTGKKVAVMTSESGTAAMENATAAAVEDGEVLHTKAPVSLLVERSALTALTWLLVLVSPIILVIGLVMNSYALSQPGSLEGFLKWLLNTPENPSFSIFSGVFSYPWPYQASGVLPLQIGYFFVIFMMAWLLLISPVFLSVCSAVLWAVPLSPSAQKRVLHLSQFLFNWQFLDLYVVCLIALNLLNSIVSRVMEAIINHNSALAGTCAPLKDNMGIQCITVQVELLSGIAFAVVGVGLWLTTKFLVEHHAKKVVGE